jgi:hypothetical protein
MDIQRCRGILDLEIKSGVAGGSCQRFLKFLVVSDACSENPFNIISA